MKTALFILLGILDVIIAYVLFLVVLALCVDTHKEYKTISPFYRWVLTGVGHLMLFLSHIRLTVEGKELLPKGRFLFVQNHRSNFDPIVSWMGFWENQLVFISKPENFKIPILGRLIRPIGFMPLDRDNPKNAIVTINAAADMMKNDAGSIGIYPEGTRNKTGEETLLPFHNGAFKIAQKANVPIVVVSAHNTAEVHKNAPWRRTDVTLRVLKVLSAEQVKAMRTAEISDEVFALLKNDLEA